MPGTAESLARGIVTAIATAAVLFLVVRFLAPGIMDDPDQPTTLIGAAVWAGAIAVGILVALRGRRK